MAELKTLLSKRAQLKGALTRCETFLDKISSQNIDERIISIIELRQKNLTENFKAFHDIQCQIALIVDDENCEELEKETDDFEDRYYQIFAEFKQLTRTDSSDNTSTHSGQSRVPENYTTVDTQNYTNTTSQPEKTVNAIGPQAQLPLMKLPTFNGEYGKWLEFRDTFEALVDRNSELSDIQKLHYLRSCLGHEALATINSIPITAASYQLSVDTLKNRYERNQLIVRSHVKTILSLPRPSKGSAKDLRNFCNILTNNIRALKNLKEPVESWDTILVEIISEKLDTATRQEWEKYSTTHDSHAVFDLTNLINRRCDILEKMEFNRDSNDPNAHHKFISGMKSNTKNKVQQGVYITSSSRFSLCDCKENHPIYYCKKFLDLTPKQRQSQIKKLEVCINCFQKNHRVENCISKHKCKKCGKRHNTLLHIEREENSDSPCALTNLFSKAPQVGQALLSTVIVYVLDSKGKKQRCRALLDNGSMNNFITKEFKEKLGLHSKSINLSITGVGQSVLDVKQRVEINFMSEGSNFKKSIQCIVLETITSNLPLVSFRKNSIKLPKGIKLADPNFNVSQPVDLLLGASVFWEILRPNKHSVINSNVYLQETELGWVLGGQLFDTIHTSQKAVNCLSINKELEILLTKFWETEENLENQAIPKSKMHEECENHFLNNVKRYQDGKYIVRVPFKENINQLGQSRSQAEKRFYSTERRLIKNPKLYKEYAEFMKEYIDLGHMVPIKEIHSEEELNYYIPHHAVVRENSLTTKVRVVFDASMKSDSGLSLNNVQHVGPTIQNELISLLLNFRAHEFVMTADISKMYRMIWLDIEDRKFHRIFWRNSQTEPLQCYELKTVTYGTASAPYLAIRCLHHLAEQNQQNFPQASRAIKNNFYVDDFICGADSEDELLNLQREVTNILHDAGFELRKWLCNKKHLYNKFKINNNLECSVLLFGEKELNKTLGVAWDAERDCIKYLQTSLTKATGKTKRTILSELSRVFDPLGLLGPIVVKGKIIMQNLWGEKIGWDDAIPTEILRNWQNFREDLSKLNSITIPRHVVLPQSIVIELHGFGDASQKAYGAAIYLKSITQDGRAVSSLLCAKSRVAPVNQQTLPRLELCAAVLVARLATKVQNLLNKNINDCYFWSDSKIVLSWIKSCPTKWQTYVANRVSVIQRLTKIEHWHHVSSADNPADLLSRGSTINELAENKLWWQGPCWLTTGIIPDQTIYQEPVEALKEAKKSINLVAHPSLQTNLISAYSSLTKLTRIAAYCLRFMANCKVQGKDRNFGPLRVEELERAFHKLIAVIQREYYPNEIHNLKRNVPISSTSHLLSLNPFLHKDGLMRVGGRIKNSFCSFEKKHPIILPPHTHFTILVFQDYHDRYYHCGPTQLLYAVREQFWPINGRNIARRVVRECKVCFMAKPRPSQYLMGNLPKIRITQCIPFTYVGLDYAGPFMLRDRATRGSKLIKAYICLFICLTTKAIHLEIVSDLTTAAFLACLRRFISRRGKPSQLFSDNAKTFIGAKKEIKELYNLINNNSEKIQSSLTQEGISWQFIPPRAPNFGGIWEAGVKSVKHHLVRVLGMSHLTYEQFSTVLCQIECILNSRPLCPLSSDPNDTEPLTPGHFLLNKAPMSLPDKENYLSIPENRLNRFRQLQRLSQHFWKRWHREYISQLQQRVKWKAATRQELQLGTLVLLKEDQTPPMTWQLARITDVHPGEDGVVRVVTIKAGGKYFKRPVTKICVLPNQN